MVFIKDLIENGNVSEVYLCKGKQLGTAKNGSNYLTFTFMDKTGTIDGKIWDVSEDTMSDLEEITVGSFVNVRGAITSFNGKLQISISGISMADEYDESNYYPITDKNIEEMWNKTTELVNSVENEFLNALLKEFFDNDKIKNGYMKSSAAKSIHHAFIGGLLEHSLNVALHCKNYCELYPNTFNYDLLITAALLHDIGKIRELSAFPENDYTDEGNLLGHVYMGAEMITIKSKNIPNFPRVLLTELKHCILAHHGELEYGSPKKPSLIEALALSYADGTDAKIQTFKEKIASANEYEYVSDRFLGLNVRKTYGQ
jgi:3'-5' exoribonuclease